MFYYFLSHDKHAQVSIKCLQNVLILIKLVLIKYFNYITEENLGKERMRHKHEPRKCGPSLETWCRI
jgi:hypothetical protein